MEIERIKNVSKSDNIFINLIEENDKIRKIKIYISNLDKLKLLNKSLTICAHIFIMVIFEIYFFFDFVIDIENKKFIGKIEKYFRNLEPIRTTEIEKEFITQLIYNKYEEGFIHDLFIKYTESMKEEDNKLHQLLIKSYIMASVIGIVFIIFVILSFLNHKKIEWKIIIIENIFMFLFLGIFEYFFFITIIMKYEPVTNEEIQYKLINGFIGYLNKTETG